MSLGIGSSGVWIGLGTGVPDGGNATTVFLFANLDGGFTHSVFLSTQVMDGGSA